MNDFKIYTVYDRVAGTYGEIFCMLNDELAIRRFNYVMSNAPMVAADCELYMVGSYDTATGCIAALEKPAFIVRFEVKNG